MMSRWLSLLVVVLLVSLFSLFVGLRLSLPSDGARIRPGDRGEVNGDLKLTPLVHHPDGLEASDVVVEIEGYSMEAWANDILRSTLPRPDWEKGGTAAYQARRDGRNLSVDQPLGNYPLLEVIRQDWGTYFFAVTFLLLGAFAYSRKPDETAVQLLFVCSACVIASLAWTMGLQASDFVFGLHFLVYELLTTVGFSLLWAFVLHLTLIYPKPQPWLRGRPWVIPLIYLGPVLLNVGWAAVTYHLAPSRLAWLSQLGVATSMVPVVYGVPIVIAVVLAARFADDPVSKAQIRWVFFTLAIALLFQLIFEIIPLLLIGRPLLNSNVTGIVWLLFVIGLVIAIFRYQLFSIDIIIRRTTSYAILTGLLVLIYFSSVVVLQRLLSPITGESTVAVVLSTLLIAALFLPLRRRIQQAIDRRFFRQKYNAEQVLAQFAATVRDETDLDELAAELARVIQETMQPEFVSVWLRPTSPVQAPVAGLMPEEPAQG